MKASSIKKFTLFFGLIAFTDLIAVQLGFPILHSLAKPLLMPVLAAMLYNTGFAGTKKLVFIGLFFSWWGDIFLLLDSRGSLFFIAGLACFFNHPYIVYFLFFIDKKSSPFFIKKTTCMDCSNP